MKESDFRPLDNSSYGIFTEFTEKFFTESCERSWINLQLYRDTYSWRYCRIDHRLWIGSLAAGYIFYPIGEDLPPQDLFRHLAEFAGYCHGRCVCGDIPEGYPEKFPDAKQVLKKLESDAGEADYIYDLRHLHSFSGSKLRKRHNQVRQFDREYENQFSMEILNSSNLPEITGLAAELSAGYWSGESGNEEKLALGNLAEMLSEPAAGLDGIVLKVNGKAAAFSVFSALSNDLADVHFEKADQHYRGCGAKMTAVLTEYLLEKGFSFMNREQDLGEEGLRRAKQALDPDHQFVRLNAEIIL